MADFGSCRERPSHGREDGAAEITRRQRRDAKSPDIRRPGAGSARCPILECWNARPDTSPLGMQDLTLRRFAPFTPYQWRNGATSEPPTSAFSRASRSQYDHIASTSTREIFRYLANPSARKSILPSKHSLDDERSPTGNRLPYSIAMQMSGNCQAARRNRECDFRHHPKSSQHGQTRQIFV